MKQQMERIRQHVKEHKTTYLVGAAGVVVGAASVIMTGRSESGAQIVQKVQQIGFGHRANLYVIQFVERSTPSQPVHLVGTNLYFSSMSEAARETGHNLSAISKNVRGLIPNIQGDVFEAVELVA